MVWSSTTAKRRKRAHFRWDGREKTPLTKDEADLVAADMTDNKGVPYHPYVCTLCRSIEERCSDGRIWHVGCWWKPVEPVFRYTDMWPEIGERAAYCLKAENELGKVKRRAAIRKRCQKALYRAVLKRQDYDTVRDLLAV